MCRKQGCWEGGGEAASPDKPLQPWQESWCTSLKGSEQFSGSVSPLPSAGTVGFVRFLLCLDGFNDCFNSAGPEAGGKQEHLAAWFSLHLFRGKGLVLLGRENLMPIRGRIL